MTRAFIPAVQVSPETKEKADKAAADGGFPTVTAWARSVIRKALGEEGDNTPSVGRLLDEVLEEAYIGGGHRTIRTATVGTFRRAISRLRERYGVGDALALVPRMIVPLLELEITFIRKVAEHYDVPLDFFVRRHLMRAAVGDAPGKLDYLLHDTEATYKARGERCPWWLDEAEEKTVESSYYSLVQYTDVEYHSLLEAEGRARAKGDNDADWFKTQGMKAVYAILAEPSPYSHLTMQCGACQHTGPEPTFRDERGAGKATCPQCGAFECAPVQDYTTATPNDTQGEMRVVEGAQVIPSPEKYR